MLGVSCTGAAVYTVGLLGLMVMTPTYITCAALAMEPSTAVAMMFAVLVVVVVVVGDGLWWVEMVVMVV